MRYEPHTPETERFLADRFNGAFTQEDRESYEDCDLRSCLVCGNRFTSEQDFEPDARDVHGEWICEGCDAEESHDPIGRDGF